MPEKQQAHTLTHPFLPELDDEEIIRQIEEDRKNLEKLLGKDIVGLAYPGGGIGGVNINEHIISLIRKILKSNMPEPLYVVDDGTINVSQICRQ